MGKHSVNRFMWKDSVGVSGQDAVLPLWIKFHFKRVNVLGVRIKISVENRESGNGAAFSCWGTHFREYFNHQPT